MSGGLNMKIVPDIGTRQLKIERLSVTVERLDDLRYI